MNTKVKKNSNWAKRHCPKREIARLTALDNLPEGKYLDGDRRTDKEYPSAVNFVMYEGYEINKKYDKGFWKIDLEKEIKRLRKEVARVSRRAREINYISKDTEGIYSNDEITVEETGKPFQWKGYTCTIIQTGNEHIQNVWIDNEKKTIHIEQQDPVTAPREKGWYLTQHYTTEYAKSYGHAPNETTLRRFIFQGDDGRMYDLDLRGSKKDPETPYNDKNIAKLVRPAQFQKGKVIQQGDQLFKRVSDYSDKEAKKRRITHERTRIGLHKFEVPVLFSNTKIGIPETTKLKHPSHPTIELLPGIYEYGETLSFNNGGGTD